MSYFQNGNYCENVFIGVYFCYMRFIYLLFTIVVCGGILFADFVYTCMKKSMNMLFCPLKAILRRFKGGGR